MSLNILNHRNENDCPFCGYDQDGLEWLKTKVDIQKGSKKDKIVVTSYCPKCGELSWRHYDKDTTPQIIEVLEMENEAIIQ